VHQGIDVYMEHNSSFAPERRRTVWSEHLVYERERGRFKIFPRQSGGCWPLAESGPGLQKLPATVGSTLATAHALAYNAGADLIDMEFVQFHPTGMVWPPSVMGILVTEGVRGEGGILTNKRGSPFLCSMRSRKNYRTQNRRQRRRRLALLSGRQRCAAATGNSLRAIMSHVASCAEIKEGRGSPHGRGLSRHFLDQAKSCRTRPSTLSASFRACITSFKTAGRQSISQSNPMEVGANDALHHGRRASGSRYADVACSRLVLPRGECAARN